MMLYYILVKTTLIKQVITLLKGTYAIIATVFVPNMFYNIQNYTILNKA